MCGGALQTGSPLHRHSPNGAPLPSPRKDVPCECVCVEMCVCVCGNGTREDRAGHSALLSSLCPAFCCADGSGGIWSWIGRIVWPSPLTPFPISFLIHTPLPSYITLELVRSVTLDSCTSPPTSLIILLLHRCIIIAHCIPFPFVYTCSGRRQLPAVGGNAWKCITHNVKCSVVLVWHNLGGPEASVRIA